MRFYQNLNTLSGRPYNSGYRAPSTALFNTDLATIHISSKEESFDFTDIVQPPCFIDILVDFHIIPLPNEQIQATYQFNETIWPPVPLYPRDEPHFVQGIQCIYGGEIKIRQNKQSESIHAGKTLDGFEIVMGEGDLLHTHLFDFQSTSIEFRVQEKRVQIPIWPVGGFYRPECKLEEIQQVFCSLSEMNQKTFVRKTYLTQWHEQGFSPPQTKDKEGQITFFQTKRQTLYTRFIDEVRQGGISLPLCIPGGDPSTYLMYKSIDIKPHVSGKAFIHFMKSQDY